jgi:hypothetical protein
MMETDFQKIKSYQNGAGDCAAQLIRNSFKEINQRDFASLEIMYAKMDSTHQKKPQNRSL